MHSSTSSAPHGQEGAPVLGAAPNETDLLMRVRRELENRMGSLRDLAKSADMSYDTVRRIKAGRHDPAYGKVKQLALLLGIEK